jgi:hypothetical protein
LDVALLGGSVDVDSEVLLDALESAVRFDGLADGAVTNQNSLDTTTDPLAWHMTQHTIYELVLFCSAHRFGSQFVALSRLSTSIGQQMGFEASRGSRGSRYCRR